MGTVHVAPKPSVWRSVWLLIVVLTIVVGGLWWVRRLLTYVFDKMHGGQ